MPVTMKVRKLLFVCLLGVVASMWAAALFAQDRDRTSRSERARESRDRGYRLEVEVELVNVTATVVDGRGRYVEGLAEDDFVVLEDGIEQETAFFSHDRRVPISMGIVLDVSGSMKYKLKRALETTREITSLLSPNDEVFLLTFDSEVKLRQSFVDAGASVQRALRGLKAGGETAVFDGIHLALREMEFARHNKKILLLVTDGFDTKSKVKLEYIEDLLKREDVLVYAIGIDDADDDSTSFRRPRYHVYHYMLGRLTSVTGGRAFRLFADRDYALRSLAQVLVEELHQQYTLSYYSSGSTAQTAWREIRVRLSEPGPTVRHRTGYYVRSFPQPTQ